MRSSCIDFCELEIITQVHDGFGMPKLPSRIQAIHVDVFQVL